MKFQILCITASTSILLMALITTVHSANLFRHAEEVRLGARAFGAQDDDIKGKENILQDGFIVGDDAEPAPEGSSQSIDVSSEDNADNDDPVAEIESGSVVNDSNADMGSAEQTMGGYEDEEDEENTNSRAEEQTTDAPEEITYNPDEQLCTTYFPVNHNLTDSQIQTKCDTIQLAKFVCMTTCKFVPPTTTTTEYSGPPTTTTAAPVPRDCNPDDPAKPQLQSDDTFYCDDRDVSQCNDTIIGDIEMKVLCQLKCDYCIPPTTTTEYTGPPTTTTTPIPPKMCDRENGTSTPQYDELGYCLIRFRNKPAGEIRGICQQTINGNLTIAHLCEETCDYCPGDEDAEPYDQEQGQEEDQGVEQGQGGEEQEQEPQEQAQDGQAQEQDEQEQEGQEQEQEEQEQEQQEQGEEGENQDEQEDNEVERK